MTATREEALAAFLQKKESLKEALAASIVTQLESMGDEIQGLSWFPSTSQKYWESRYQRAA